MKRFLAFGVAALFPLRAGAVTVTVDAGDTVNGGSVQQIVTQNVEGVTNNLTIYGTQNVMLGGVSNNSLIYTYGQQTVNAGGTASGSTVMQQGVMNVLGAANNTNIRAYGDMTVRSGGTTKLTEINGGRMYVLSGGSSFNTVLNSGTQYVSGTDSDSEVNGGQQIVRSGGTVTSAVLKGGVQNIQDGGTAVGTQIYGGQQSVSGTAENSRLFDGMITVNPDGILSSPEISGGVLNVSYDATVENLIMTGGSADVEEDGILSGNTKISDAEITFHGDTSLSNLELHNAVVRSVPAWGYDRLEIDNLSGNGKFYLTSSVSDAQSDQLVIHNGSGNFGVGLADYSSGTDFPDEIHLVESDSPDENFYLLGGAADIGAYRYDLAKVGDEWVLNRTPYLSDSSQVAKNAYNALSSILYTHTDSLNERLGELHRKDKYGLWMRGFGRKVKLDFRDATDSKVNVAGTQIGFDKDIKQDWFERWLAGVYGGYSDARQKFDRAGRADSDTYSLGLYSTIEAANGVYLDLVGTYFHHKQKVTSYLPMGWAVKGDYDADSWSFSAETGRRWTFDNNWFVEPQLQLSYMLIDDIDYRTNFNTRVQGRNADSFLGRIGVMSGKRFDDVLDFPFEAFVRFSVLEEFKGEAKVLVADYQFDEDVSDTMFRLGVGVSAELSEKFSLHANLATIWGDKISVPVEGNLGLRYSF